jgi:hypothetical protein
MNTVESREPLGPPWLATMATLFAAIIHPIAWPAWLIEWLVSRRRPGWQFSPWSATPYLSTVALASAAGVTIGTALTAGVGIYLLTAMEALCLWICVAVAIGRPGATYSLLTRYGRRRARIPTTMFSRATLYMGVVSYGYTMFYFGILDSLLFRAEPTSFAGVEATTPWGVAWQFLYYSTITIATVGYGDITPKRPLSQAVAACEVLIGMFFALFLFAAFVSFHVNRVSKDDVS